MTDIRIKARAISILYHDVLPGLAAYASTSLPVLAGILLFLTFHRREYNDSPGSDMGILAVCCRSNAIHYLDIASRGYTYDPDHRSNVAFFPGYPLAVLFLYHGTGWSERLSLIVVSNGMLTAAFITFSSYLRCRSPQIPPQSRCLVLAVFGLWPSGMFFRMPYSESTFLLLGFLVFLGMCRGWRLPLLGFFTGAATGVRPIGLALTVAFLCHVLSRSSNRATFRGWLHAALMTLLACWGLIGFMVYQQIIFGTPLAFAQTQVHWNLIAPVDGAAINKLTSLLAGEPIWGVYSSDPARSWRVSDPHTIFLFNIFFWNPILFSGVFCLVIFGAVKSWLTVPEVVFAIGLLAIPYVTRAHEMSMTAHGRFAAIVFPVYLVLGHVLVVQPDWVKCSVLAGMAMMLMVWACLFSAGFPVY